ncbi:hypothetical protein [Hydrocarboniphaga sp.]|uniref:hypothetical protein n=1 Tax=Hydrocarboniphaga sp. TaxID=2033016 RepID=UPI0026147CE1|nr:hypothetical protein [Hydrocarboniphaga sp.]
MDIKGHFWLELIMRLTTPAYWRASRSVSSGLSIGRGLAIPCIAVGAAVTEAVDDGEVKVEGGGGAATATAGSAGAGADICGAVGAGVGAAISGFSTALGFGFGLGFTRGFTSDSSGCSVGVTGEAATLICAATLSAGIVNTVSIAGGSGSFSGGGVTGRSAISSTATCNSTAITMPSRLASGLPLAFFRKGF